jgi:hypothetical protein
MNQRQIILQAWQRRKKNRTPSAQLRKADAFFDFVSQQTDLCWPELVAEFRSNYYDAFDEIVPTLLDTDDPIIIYNSLQVADLANSREADVANKIIRDCDADKHAVTLQALAKYPALHPTMRQKSKLPDFVRAAMKGPVPTKPR